MYMDNKYLNDKNELANCITNIFSSPQTITLLQEFFSGNNPSKARPDRFFGNLLNYLVITRNGSINSDTLKSIISHTLQPNDLQFGTLLANSLKQQLADQNIAPTNDNVLAQFKTNYIDNGFYMHAFNGANYESISQNGLIGKNSFMKKEFDVLSRYLRYDYDLNSYRVFATDNYSLLYNYGNLSPEWLYYYVNKNSDCLFFKDKQLSLSNMTDFANSIRPLNDDQLKELITAGNKVLDHYFSSDFFGLAIIDKYLQSTTYGNRVFNRYDEEEPINLSDFISQSVVSKVTQYIDYNKYFANGNVSEERSLGLCIMYLKNKYTTYEVSTICNIEPKDMAIATLPAHSKIFSRTPEKVL